MGSDIGRFRPGLGHINRKYGLVLEQFCAGCYDLAREHISKAAQRMGFRREQIVG
jgi:hypothetical protein